MESNTRLVNDVPMRWEETGEGVPLVLVHGIPTCPALWRHVVPLLRGARCLAWEMVGYGASIPQGRGRDISVGRQADYLISWMDALEIESAVLAGHDLGGGVVQIAAIRQPSRCAGLFLTNSIGYDSWPIPSVKAMRAAGAALRYMPNAAAKLVLTLLYARGHDDRAKASEALEVHWPHYARHDAAEVIVRQVAALDVRDTLEISDRLSTLDVPSRVVWGDADRFQKVEFGERLARDLRAPLARIQGGKHFTPEDHPREVALGLNELVTEAARKLPGAPGGQDARLSSGRRVFRRHPEVMEDSAPERVREIYRDIQSSLRVPFINLLFRMLANDPDYLEAAWGYVRPVVRTSGFERWASELRQQSLPPASEALATRTGADVPEAIRRFTSSIHYVLPKLLLIVMLLDPDVGRLEASGETELELDPRELPYGVSEDMERIEMVDPDSADERLRNLFERIRETHGHPVVATYYRSLGHWPDLLETLWARIEPEVGSPEYEALKSSVSARAEKIAKAIGASLPPRPGVSNELGALLTVFRLQFVPDLLMDVSFITRLLGIPERAR